MRKSGWAAAAGLASVALLLTACGGSSSSPTAAATAATTQSSAASSAASTSQASTSAPSTSAPSTSAASTAASTAPSTSKPSTSAPAAQPSSGVGTIPVGTTIFTDQMSKLGFVLALANGQVVYTYAHDPAGGTPTCTGSCASIWIPVTGNPKVVLGETLPGTLGLVTRADGTKQVTYNGHPLYTFKGAKFGSTAANGTGGVWYVVKLPAP